MLIKLSTFSAAQALLAKSTPPVSYFHWVYPPTMLLLVAPIARLPYVVAFFAWLAATLGLYAAALYTIVPFLLTIVLACLPLPAVKNAFDGQTAFLLAGLLGLSMFFMSRRPYTFWNLLGNTDLQAAIHNLLSTNAINYRTVARHCRSNCERLVIRRGSCTDVRVQRLAIVFAFFPGRSRGLISSEPSGSESDGFRSDA